MEFYIVVECVGEQYVLVSGLYVSLAHALEHATAEDARGRRLYVLSLSGGIVQIPRTENDVPASDPPIPVPDPPVQETETCQQPMMTSWSA